VVLQTRQHHASLPTKTVFPVLFISGQVQRNDNIRSRGGKDRGYFGSDCDIVECVKGITKYAVELTDPRDTHRVLEECYENLTTGRLGPVWLSVPVDVQAMHMLPPEFLTLWSEAKRPIVVAGNGIHVSKTRDKFTKFIEHHTLPYVVSYFGSDLGDDYVGKVGILGNRSGNFAIQNADLVLCLGCRLSKSVTGYNRHLFAREAKVIYLDIDESEFMDAKNLDLKIHMDLRTFFDVDIPQNNNIDPKWISKTKEWKDNWSCELPPKGGPLVCPYRHLNAFFNTKPPNSCVTASSGSIYCVVWHMYRHKEGDRFVTSSHGDMGYEMPVAMGASMHGQRTYAILGDGSFQFNIQELQTLKHKNLPVTVMVFNNSGYGAIKITQNTMFKREFGTSSVSDITFCDIEKVTKAYDIPYYKVEEDDDVGYLEHTDGPIVVEVVCNDQKRFPSVSNKPMPDGTFKNMPHEEMAPFLDDEVLEDNMFVQRI
jgi:acetolactate synthase I/II/III large subunit